MTWYAVDPIEGVLSSSGTKASAMAMASINRTFKVRPGLYQDVASDACVGQADALREAGFGWALDGKRNPGLDRAEGYALTAARNLRHGDVVRLAGAMEEPIIHINTETEWFENREYLVVRVLDGDVPRTLFFRPNQQVWAKHQGDI